ncbi:amidase family protein [Novosphingobium resinovorum]
METCTKALKAFEAIGMTVEEATLAEPASEMWRTAVALRHWSVGADLQGFYDDPAKRALMKPEAIWEVEGGMKLTGPQLAKASEGRTRIYNAFAAAFEKFDFLVLPSAQVFPFDASEHWPTEIAGKAMNSYHRWMEVTLPATMAGLPALAVPVASAVRASFPSVFRSSAGAMRIWRCCKSAMLTRRHRRGSPRACHPPCRDCAER